LNGPSCFEIGTTPEGSVGSFKLMVPFSICGRSEKMAQDSNKSRFDSHSVKVEAILYAGVILAK